ncbi:MAG TPA: DUF4350 domain-containing protein [bacterium]|nr:DUF4350 domain-containing protein [bacterium]
MSRRALKRLALTIGALLILTPIASFAIAAFLWSQRADYGWSPAIDEPTYKDSHPVVVVDAAHHNASAADWTGRYFPFARLLRADGYDVRSGNDAFTPENLDGVDVLVIVNASGAAKPQLFGINLPFGEGSSEDRARSAFTRDEICHIYEWVAGGGSILLIADHAPFGAAAADLAEVFGVTMYKGFVEVPGELSDPLEFSSANGRLGAHPILSGDSPHSVISRVATFTGQSLEGPDDAAVLLRLPESAIEYIPSDRDGQFDSTSAGVAQGLAMTVGMGRMVVLGEAAMLTAQVHNRVPFGMNLPGYDNRQFARNIMRWLTRNL